LFVRLVRLVYVWFHTVHVPVRWLVYVHYVRSFVDVVRLRLFAVRLIVVRSVGYTFWLFGWLPFWLRLVRSFGLAFRLFPRSLVYVRLVGLLFTRLCCWLHMVGYTRSFTRLGWFTFSSGWLVYFIWLGSFHVWFVYVPCYWFTFVLFSFYVSFVIRWFVVTFDYVSFTFVYTVHVAFTLPTFTFVYV